MVLSDWQLFNLWKQVIGSHMGKLVYILPFSHRGEHRFISNTSSQKCRVCILTVSICCYFDDNVQEQLIFF